MSEPANAPEAARLDELAAVTSEYARYSRSVFGLALAGTGAWWFAALSIHWGAGGGEILTLLTPLVWMALLVKARAYYQKHGEVLEQETDVYPLPQGLPRAFFLCAIYLSCVFGIWGELEGARRGDAFLGVATLVAIPVLAFRVTRGMTDAVVTCSMVIAVRRRTPSRGELLFDLLLAAGLIAIGISQHHGYRRLEHRLAALKVRA